MYNIKKEIHLESPDRRRFECVSRLLPGPKIWMQLITDLKPRITRNIFKKVKYHLQLLLI